MKIFIVGEKGQLASELIRAFMPLGETISTDYPRFDISNKSQVQEAISHALPDVVINASAYTNVDLAETERAKAAAVNTSGPGFLSAVCKEYQIPMIHYSTDFVFDGKKRSPYVETDQPNPLSFYGKTKYDGETAILGETDSALIFRLAWLYTVGGNSFISKAQQWAMKNEKLTFVDDQVGNPTWARYTALATASIVRQADLSSGSLYEWIKERNGVYHLTSSGEASRYDWGCEILRLSADRYSFKVKEIIRGKTIDFPSPAERPAYSALCCDKAANAFKVHIPDWKTQLKLCMG